jgi:cell fate regulator YaaT (PSP1 superfamily)
MIEVIGVKFKSGGKMYYFAPGDLNPAEGSYVVVETARGPECGEVAARRHAVQDESITAPLKPILRLATEEDMQILEKNRAYMAEAMRVCEERIAARELPMRLVDVECGFDSNKLIFYFTAESRVDFRELVKDLALAFHVRIELRQIGDRDEAKLLGGLGICGREFWAISIISSPSRSKWQRSRGLRSIRRKFPARAAG